MPHTDLYNYSIQIPYLLFTACHIMQPRTSLLPPKMATSSGLFLSTIYNQSQLAERKHVARYWSINTAATAVPLSAHSSPLFITTKLAAAMLGGSVRTRCSAGPVLPLWCHTCFYVFLVYCSVSKQWPLVTEQCVNVWHSVAACVPCLWTLSPLIMSIATMWFTYTTTTNTAVLQSVRTGGVKRSWSLGPIHAAGRENSPLKFSCKLYCPFRSHFWRRLSSKV